MGDLFYILILLTGIIFALISGLCLGRLILIKKKNNLSRKFRREAAGVEDIEFNNSFIATGLARKVLNYLIKISYSISHVNEQPRFSKGIIKSNELSKKINDLSIKCSMPLVFGNFAFREVQLRFAFIGFCAGAFVGVMFSYILMLLLSLTGIFIGVYLPV